MTLRFKRTLSPQQSGFTLIELLVVLTLMGLVLSLVGPLSVDSFEKIRSRDEVLKLKHFLRSASAEAFLSGQWLRIEARENRVAMGNEDGERMSKDFTYLSFPDQVLDLSPQGLPQTRQLRYQRRGRAEALSFGELLQPNKKTESSEPNG